jgi:lipopolysaccharide biosynthesis glycosyltransferase/glycosyltransferase involved in cell wall biosynthesis
MTGVDRFYRHLILRHPSFRFTVLHGVDIPVAKTIPTNVTLLPFREKTGKILVPHESSWIPEMLARRARNISASVAGREFDVIDTASIEPIAHLLATACAEQGVRYRRLALGLHGWSSDARANEFECADPAALIADFSLHESLALKAADLRYAFSPLCLADSRERTRQGVLAFDPADAFADRGLVPCDEERAGPVDVVQIGWAAGYKGADLLIACLAGIAKSLVARLKIVGRAATQFGSPPRSVLGYLQDVAARHDVTIDFVEEPSDAWIEAYVYRSRAIVSLASRPRSETFGFSAAEALVRGVPILLSKHAGLAEVLRQQWPHYPVDIFDPDDPAAARQIIRALAGNYDRCRAELAKSLTRYPLRPARDHFLAAAYGANGFGDSAALAEGCRLLGEMRFARPCVTLGEPPPVRGTSDVELAFAVDEAMAPVAAVAISSLARRISRKRRYVLHVLHLGLSRASQDLLAAAASGTKIRFLQVELPATLMLEHDRLPPVTNIRLILPDALASTQRVIYLDADIVVRTDIAELFDLPLEGAPLAAARDECISQLNAANWPSHSDAIQGDSGRYFRTMLELAPGQLDHYFNAGVLIMDLEKLRAENFVAHACAFAERKNRSLVFRDQDILNHVLQGRCKELEPRWNALSRYGAGPSDDRNAAIVHFSGLERPWVAPETAGAAIFWQEAEFSPAREAIRALLQTNLARVSNRHVGATPARDRDVFGQWLTARECRARLSAYGLSADEAEGAWIVRETLALYLLVDVLPRKIEVTVEGFTFAAERGQRATLSIGGACQTVPILPGQTRINLFVEVPDGMRLVGNRYLPVELGISGFIVPAEEGWSHDIRLLRFFLKRIKIEAEFAPARSRPWPDRVLLRG